MQFQFDQFHVDTERRLLMRAGAPVHLSPKAFHLLTILLESTPRALSKEQLHERIWAGTFVEESSLSGLIGELRSALQDDAKQPRYIRTVHRFGYAFCGPLADTVKRVQAALVVFRGVESPLFEGENVLGRDPAADICIDDSTVSRRHACITVSGNVATLTDLKSKNGTVLEGKNVESPLILEDGQTFVLGDARVTYRTGRNLASTVTSSNL